MNIYKNLGGNSGIVKYESGPDYIKVQFYDDSLYVYTDASAGSENITIMKHLAIRGVGLNSYIMRNVYKKYERKYRIAEATPDTLKKGLIVQLNSGGPEMTCFSEPEGNMITCAWFNTGELRKDNFPIEALNILSQCEKIIEEDEEY
jgi:uncharacterized protein YodC (DUF2158 family)